LATGPEKLEFQSLFLFFARKLFDVFFITKLSHIFAVINRKTSSDCVGILPVIAKRLL